MDLAGWAIVLTLASHHVRAQPGLEAFNPGAGVEVLVGRAHVGAGLYRNSSRRASVYGVVGVERRVRPWLAAGVEAGAVTGYRVPVLPIAFPYVRLDLTPSLAVRVLIWPSPRPILGFQVRWVS